ncbi:MAG: hypothetical protein ABIB12_01855 [Patescibacteria group bacterium]
MGTDQLPQDKWGNNLGEIFRALLTERGITEYASVYSTAEGTELPGGLEACSFWILTPSDGKLWDYTIAWDSEKLNPDGEKGYYTLTEPREAAGWEDKPDYIRARKELGLPFTEEQERILREKGE